MNIVLIGMPTAGKSTAGVILAKLLGYQFMDSDLIIQTNEGMLLKDIIAKKGVDGFLETENRINAGIEAENAVIATGGSVIYGEAAMKHLREIGTVVYLRLNLSTIASRLDNVQQRGVVLRANQTLDDLYRERCPLYEKYADVIVDGEDLDVEKLVQKIIASV